MLERKTFLKLGDDEMKEYAFLLSDEYKYNSFFSFVKAFKTTEAIRKQVSENKTNNMNVKILNETNNKILLLRQFEKDNHIKAYDLNFEDSKDVKVSITDDMFKHLKDIFRMTKSKPTNINGLKNMYIGMLKNVFGSLDVILGKRTKTKERKYVIIYSFNDALVKQLFKITFKIKVNNLDDVLMKSVDVIKPAEMNTKDNDKFKYEF